MKTSIFYLLIVMLSGYSLMAADILDSSIVTDPAIISLEAKVKDLVSSTSDFNSALKLYAGAARQNSDNPYFKDQYSILRRVIKMKSALDKAADKNDKPNEKVLERLSSYYQAVRAYYYSKGFYSESMKLDEMAMKLVPGQQQTLNYLESVVVVNPDDASDTVSSICADSADEASEYELFNLLMKSRNAGSSDLTSEIDKITVDPEANPAGFVYLACIYKNAGDETKAYEMVQKALEHTVPSEINGTRILASSMKEFKDDVNSDKFAAVLKTESKVAQSGCTGGSSCGSCSLKGKCPSTK